MNRDTEDALFDAGVRAALERREIRKPPIVIAVSISGGLVDGVRTDYDGPATYFVADEDILDGCSATRDAAGNKAACACAERHPDTPAEDIAEHVDVFDAMRRYADLPNAAE